MAFGLNETSTSKDAARKDLNCSESDSGFLICGVPVVAIRYKAVCAQTCQSGEGEAGRRGRREAGREERERKGMYGSSETGRHIAVVVRSAIRLQQCMPLSGRILRENKKQHIKYQKPTRA